MIENTANTLKAILNPDHKVCVFIDGSNMFSTAKNLNLMIDYKKFRELFFLNCDLIRICYYSAILETDKETDPNPVVPLLDWLSYNGFSVTTKKATQYKYTRDGKEFTKTKGNIDIEIAVDMMMLGEHCNHIILVSGDSDFLPVVRHMQLRGKIITVMSTIKTQPSMVGDELRRQADYFVDVDDLRQTIEQSKLATKVETEKV